MRGLFISAYVFTSNILHDIGAAARGHFGNHIGGSMSGVYIRLPFTPCSAFLEWRDQWVGFGHECGAGKVEVFAGRFQGVFCVEPSAA